MSNQYLNAAWLVEGVTAGERLALVALADRASAGGFLFMSMAELGRKCCVDPRNARKAIRRLEARGLLQCTVHRGREKANNYRLLFAPESSSKNPSPGPDIEEENRTPASYIGKSETGRQHPILTLKPDASVPKIGRQHPPNPLDTLEDGGGGSARVAEAPAEEQCFGIRERILVAAKHDRSGMTATGRMIGSPTDMMSVARWHTLGLSDDEIIEVISHIAAGAHYEPIGAFRYFDQPMQRHAGLKAAPALKAVESRQRAPSEMETRVRDGSDTLERMRKKYALE